MRAKRSLIGVILATSYLLALPKLLPAADTPQPEAPPATAEILGDHH